QPGACGARRCVGWAAADGLFVHPPTSDGGRHWNAPFDDADPDAFLHRVMLPNYVGPYLRSGRVFAPRYRQASLYTRFTRRDDAREARAFAYRDVEAAFEAWLATHDDGGPLVLVGVEQGGELAERLLQTRIIPDADLRRRLAGDPRGRRAAGPGRGGAGRRAGRAAAAAP